MFQFIDCALIGGTNTAINSDDRRQDVTTIWLSKVDYGERGPGVFGPVFLIFDSLGLFTQNMSQEKFTNKRVNEVELAKFFCNVFEKQNIVDSRWIIPTYF